MGSFEGHGLLNFFSMNKKHDPELVKVFYCNFKITDERSACHFKDKLVKFSLDDFGTHFGVLARGDENCTTNSPKFSKLDFVTRISKSVFGDHLDIKIFNTSQIKFEMCILH